MDTQWFPWFLGHGKQKPFSNIVHILNAWTQNENNEKTTTEKKISIRNINCRIFIDCKLCDKWPKVAHQMHFDHEWIVMLWPQSTPANTHTHTNMHTPLVSRTFAQFECTRKCDLSLVLCYLMDLSFVVAPFFQFVFFWQNQHSIRFDLLRIARGMHWNCACFRWFKLTISFCLPSTPGATTAAAAAASNFFLSPRCKCHLNERASELSLLVQLCLNFPNMIHSVYIEQCLFGNFS